MRKAFLLVGALALLAVPTAGMAQIGVHASYGTDSDLGIGVRYNLPVPSLASGFEASFSGDYFIDCDGCTYFELNANGIWNLQNASLHPYVGAGLNYAHVSVDALDASNSDVGLNLLAGLKFPGASLTPFLEGRLELGGGEQFVISGGILFGKR